MLEPLVRTPLGGEVPRAAGLELPPTIAVRVRRLTLAPGEEVEALPEADALVQVEAGHPVVRASAPLGVIRAADEGGDGRVETAAPAGAAALRSGDAVVMPAGTPYALHNPGDGPAVALVTTVAASLFPSVAPATPPRDASPSTRRATANVGETLVEATRSVPLAAGRIEVAVGRATLAPGASFVVGEAPGPALVAVERGTLSALTAAIDGGGVARDAGEWVALPPGRPAVLRNAGPAPLALLVVTVAAGAPGEAAAPTA